MNSRLFTGCLSLVLLLVCGAAAQDGYVDIPFGETKPLVLPKPPYPAAARAERLDGAVPVRVLVDEAGEVAQVLGVSGPGAVCPSIESPGIIALLDAAGEAALKTRFTPHLLPDGTPAKFTTRIVYNFAVPRRDAPDANSRRADVTRRADFPDALKPISGGVLNGKAVELPKPVYPAAARAVRASGTVSVGVVIQTDGTVHSAEAVSGHPLLRAASRAAACEAKFSPTHLNGKPIRVRGVVSYNFVP